MTPAPRTAWDRLPGLLLAVVLCEAVGIVGALTTATGDSPWYQALEKPVFQPPSWVFGPVWTVLYALMGIAAWRVWRRRRDVAVGGAMGLFVVQLVLNGIWTPVFFGAHRIRLALVILVALVVVLTATIRSFRRVDPLAAGLLVPYLLWVLFATVLNASIVALN